jgi:hypothetical protein
VSMSCWTFGPTLTMLWELIGALTSLAAGPAPIWSLGLSVLPGSTGRAFNQSNNLGENGHNNIGTFLSINEGIVPVNATPWIP